MIFLDKMRRVMAIILLTPLCSAAMADEYKYLTFELTTGERLSVEASALTMTLSGTALVAGNQTFELSNLSKMYFSKSDDTTTGVNGLEVDGNKDVVAVYDLQGKVIDQKDIKYTDGFPDGIPCLRTDVQRQGGRCDLHVPGIFYRRNGVR